jgi:hypothetical protein
VVAALVLCSTESFTRSPAIWVSSADALIVAFVAASASGLPAILPALAPIAPLAASIACEYLQQEAKHSGILGFVWLKVCYVGAVKTTD